MMQSPQQAPGQPQQAPMGVSPATGPTPNKGYEAAGMQRLGVVVKQLTELLPMVGATSDMGQAVLKALTGLGKFVPPGSGSQAGDKNVIEQMALKNAQNGQQMQALKAQSAGAPGGGPGGGSPPPSQQPPQAAAA